MADAMRGATQASKQLPIIMAVQLHGLFAAQLHDHCATALQPEAGFAY